MTSFFIIGLIGSKLMGVEMETTVLIGAVMAIVGFVVYNTMDTNYAKAKIQQLEDSLSTMRARIRSLEKENDDLSNSCCELSNTADTLNKELAIYHEQYGELDHDVMMDWFSGTKKPNINET
jgi:hypothetical protein